MTPFQVGVAAEAFATGVLAQAGCDVLVQYGANQPGYDLVADKDNRLLRVSVKGSQNGAWGLVQGHKKEGLSYHEAIDSWLRSQKEGVLFCFVQFEGVALGGCPKIYLASSNEVAELMKSCRRGAGDTVVYEDHKYVRGALTGTRDRIPEDWKLTVERIDRYLKP